MVHARASSNPDVVTVARSRLGWFVCRMPLCVCASVVTVVDHCVLVPIGM